MAEDSKVVDSSSRTKISQLSKKFHNENGEERQG
jgi:hypothetical protein